MIHTVRGGADGEDGVVGQQASEGTSSPSSLSSSQGESLRRKAIISQISDRLGTLLPREAGYSPEEAKELVSAILEGKASAERKDLSAAVIKVLLGSFTHDDSLLQEAHSGRLSHKMHLESADARLERNEQVLRQRMAPHKYVEILEEKLGSDRSDVQIAERLGLTGQDIVERTLSMCGGMLAATYTFSADLILSGSCSMNRDRGVISPSTEEPAPHDRPREERGVRSCERSARVTKGDASPSAVEQTSPTVPEKVNSVREVEQVLAVCNRGNASLLEKECAGSLREALELFKELRDLGKSFKRWITDLGPNITPQLLQGASETKLPVEQLTILFVRSGNTKLFREQIGSLQQSTPLEAEEIGGSFCKLLPKMRAATLGLNTFLENKGSKLPDSLRSGVEKCAQYLEHSSTEFIADVMHRVSEKEEELLPRVEQALKASQKLGSLKATKSSDRPVGKSSKKEPSSSTATPKDSEKEATLPPPQEPSTQNFTSVYRGSPERIVDGLLNAKNQDWVSLTLKGGAIVSGTVIYNMDRGMGRILNPFQEISIDFRSDDVIEVKF